MYFTGNKQKTVVALLWGKRWKLCRKLCFSLCSYSKQTKNHHNYCASNWLIFLYPRNSSEKINPYWTKRAKTSLMQPNTHTHTVKIRVENFLLLPAQLTACVIHSEPICVRKVHRKTMFELVQTETFEKHIFVANRAKRKPPCLTYWKFGRNEQKRKFPWETNIHSKPKRKEKKLHATSPQTKMQW